MNLQAPSRKPLNIIPRLRSLNLRSVKIDLENFILHRKATIQLLQRIDIIDWNDKVHANIDGAMYSLLLTFKPKTHANLRFHSNLEQARNRYIGQHGKLQKTTGDKKAHSFVLQFLQAMEASIAHALNVASDAFNMTDTSNTSRSIQVTTGGTSWSFSYWAVEAPANTTTYGIQIGTGTTAPANTDHTIETIINNGVSSGQMQWGSCGVCTCAIVGSNVDLVISRAFSNSSGGTITLREIGLTGYMSNSAGPYVFLFAHDAVNQAVNTAQTATVTYMMRTTV